VDIAASSLEGSARFIDALQISVTSNVISPASDVQTNSTKTTAAIQNSS